MSLDTNNPAIAAVLGSFCTGLMYIIADVIVSRLNRRSQVNDLTTIIHDYFSEDIEHYKQIPTIYLNEGYVSFDNTNLLLNNSSNVHYIRNNTYLIKNKNLRKDIFSYLFKKDNALQYILYIQRRIDNEQSADKKSSLKNHLSQNISELYILKNLAIGLNNQFTIRK
jgi:hypothetical protein